MAVREQQTIETVVEEYSALVREGETAQAIRVLAAADTPSLREYADDVFAVVRDVLLPQFPDKATDMLRELSWLGLIRLVQSNSYRWTAGDCQSSVLLNGVRHELPAIQREWLARLTAQVPHEGVILELALPRMVFFEQRTGYFDIVSSLAVRGTADAHLVHGARGAVLRNAQVLAQFYGEKAASCHRHPSYAPHDTYDVLLAPEQPPVFYPHTN